MGRSRAGGAVRSVDTALVQDRSRPIFVHTDGLSISLERQTRASREVSLYLYADLASSVAPFGL
jgi:hypothetical protein